VKGPLWAAPLPSDASPEPKNPVTTDTGTLSAAIAQGCFGACFAGAEGAGAGPDRRAAATNRERQPIAHGKGRQPQRQRQAAPACVPPAGYAWTASPANKLCCRALPCQTCPAGFQVPSGCLEQHNTPPQATANAARPRAALHAKSPPRLELGQSAYLSDLMVNCSLQRADQAIRGAWVPEKLHMRRVGYREGNAAAAWHGAGVKGVTGHWSAAWKAQLRLLLREQGLFVHAVVAAWHSRIPFGCLVLSILPPFRSAQPPYGILRCGIDAAVISRISRRAMQGQVMQCGLSGECARRRGCPRQRAAR